MKLFRFVGIAITTAMISSIGYAETVCPLPNEAIQSDTCNKGETGDCNRTILFDDDAIVFTEQMRVNTDGHIRSYSAKDPSGSRCKAPGLSDDPFGNGCAMNTICNGVHITYPNGRKLMGTGKTDSKTEVSCSKLLGEFTRIRDAKWLPSDGSRVDWRSVIRTQARKGKKSAMPCMVDDFMVSMASARSGLKNLDRCDQKQYLNSDVPSVVVPRCWSKVYRNKNPKTCKKHLSNKDFPNVEPGSLAAIRLRKNPDQMIFAVVGDAGWEFKIGEASVGLHWRLRGRSGLPTTKDSTYSLDTKDLFDVIVFPGSRPEDLIITPESYAEMSEKSEEMFISWGEGKLSSAIDRLNVCALHSRPN